MLPGEYFNDLFVRVIKLYNELVALGKEITTEEIIRNVLRTLPKDIWIAKITSLQDSKDLSKMSLDEFAGTMGTHEIMLNSMNNAPAREKGIALQVDGDKSDSDIEEEAYVMFKRRFKSFNKGNKWSGNTSKPKTSTSNTN